MHQVSTVLAAFARLPLPPALLDALVTHATTTPGVPRSAVATNPDLTPTHYQELTAGLDAHARAIVLRAALTRPTPTDRVLSLLGPRASVREWTVALQTTTDPKDAATLARAALGTRSPTLAEHILLTPALPLDVRWAGADVRARAKETLPPEVHTTIAALAVQLLTTAATTQEPAARAQVHDLARTATPHHPALTRSLADRLRSAPARGTRAWLLTAPDADVAAWGSDHLNTLQTILTRRPDPHGHLADQLAGRARGRTAMTDKLIQHAHPRVAGQLLTHVAATHPDRAARLVDRTDLLTDGDPAQATQAAAAITAGTGTLHPVHTVMFRTDLTPDHLDDLTHAALSAPDQPDRHLGRLGLWLATYPTATPHLRTYGADLHDQEPLPGHTNLVTAATGWDPTDPSTLNPVAAQVRPGGPHHRHLGLPGLDHLLTHAATTWLDPDMTPETARVLLTLLKNPPPTATIPELVEVAHAIAT